MREQTLVSSLTTRFTFVELTLGRMPIFTRRSRAGTCQIISARLSKKGPMVTSASDSSLPRHTSTSWYGWLRRCGGSVFWFLVYDHHSRGGNCTGLPSNTGLFLSTYLFLLERRLIPFRFFDRCSWFNSPVSSVKISSSKFLVYTPLHHGFPFLKVGNRYLLCFSISYNSNTIFCWWVSRILNLYRLSKTSSEGIFDIDNRTSSHLVSNSWMLSLRKVTENK